jgi:hypothetical protein
VTSESLSAARQALRNAILNSLTLVSLSAVGIGTAWAQSPGTFTPTGRMTVARTLHTATLLPDGKVLIAGGRVHGHQDYQGTVTASAELYDPLTGTFSSAGSMTTPRVWHTATLLPNGKVLIVGRDWAAGEDHTAELYDPSRGTFTRTGDTLSAQYGATATLLKNGKVLIAGGVTPGPGNNIPVSTPELYDPATGAFASTGRFVGPGDGFYIVGGPNSPSVTLMSDGRVLFAAEPFSEIYDPATGTFSATGEMKTTCGPFGPPNYLSGRTATLLPNGDVLLAGGGHEDCGRFAEAERYDPASGTFTLVRPMTRRRTFHTATRLPDGTVLIAGGESESGFSLVTEATAEIYDPAATTFFLAGSMQGGREGHTATPLKDGRVLFVGGAFFQDVGVFLGSLDTADLYTPGALKAPVPGFPIDGVVTEDLRPRLQVHNIPSPRPFGVVTYRFDWSDRSDFGPGSRTRGADAVPEREGPDTAYVIPDNLEFDRWYYWRARATITQSDGTTIVSGYSEVRSFRTPRRSDTELVAAASRPLASLPRVTASGQHRAVSGSESSVVPAPSALAAAASGSGLVLTWIAPPGALPVRYAISGGNAPHVSNLPVVVTPDASTHYTIPALPADTYYFRVWAIVADSMSSPSNDAAVVIGGAASASAPPSGVRARVDGAFITAAWTPSSLAGTVYQVEIGDAPGLANVAVRTTTNPSVTYPTNTTAHYLRVRAVHGSMVSAPSNEVFVAVPRVRCAAPPSAPVLLPVSTTDGATTIGWLPATGPLADHYRVEVSGSTARMTMTSDGTSTSVTATVTPGEYTARVTAINSCGDSAASNSITFTRPHPVMTAIGPSSVRRN